MADAITIQSAIADALRSDSVLMDLLPGGVWTRRIRKNDSTPEAPTPGSTPDAFDSKGRILRCASIINGEATSDPFGPPGAFYAFPEIWMRCLPLDSEKRKLEEAALRIIELLQGRMVPLHAGRGGILTISARMMPDDDPDLQPAVVDMIRARLDSVWSS